MGPDESMGLSADEAFSALANETRVEILLALWEVRDPPEEGRLTFTELRERVGMADSGQFTYHLDKLTGHFVRRTEDGYALRNAGRTVIRSVLAGTAVEDPTLERTPVEERCVHCGARAFVDYEDERLYLRCPECEGMDLPGTPEGTLVDLALPPGGLEGRSPSEAFHAARVRDAHAIWTMLERVCPECTGTVDLSVEYCESHESGGDPCPACGSHALGRAYYVCPTCKADTHVPTWLHVDPEPAVLAFHHRNGGEATLTDWGTVVARGYHEYREELLSTDPLRIRVAVPGDDERLLATLDEGLDVVEVTEDR